MLKVVGAGGVAAALRPALSSRTVLAAGKRPNILWISCEDISPHLGCYGDPFAKTPALDRFATEGTRYTNAYTVAGVCAPSRSGIISGMYPSTLGSQFMRCKARIPEFVRGFPEYLKRAGYYTTNCSKTDYNMNLPASPWDESGRNAHWKKRPQGKPFFSIFNYTLTHESKMRGLSRPKGLEPGEEQDVDKLVLPPHYPDTPNSRQNWARAYELTTLLDHIFEEKLKELEDAGLAEDTIVVFWSDHGDGLPRAKRWLYDTGTHVPLMVRIPEKFRAGGQGAPGSVDDRLVNFIDLGPTMLNLAGIEVPEHMQGRPFLGPDLPPERDYIFGARCRIDERYDIIRTARDGRFRYIRNYEPFKTYYQWVGYAEQMPMMRDIRKLHAEGKLPPAAAQFMAKEKPVEELYEPANDPYEVKNLAADPAHRAALEKLRAAMDEWMFESKDTGLIPEGELELREQKLGSRYAILREPGGDDLMRRLMELARAAGKAEMKDKTLFLDALGDRDPAVRYWAVTGLGLLGRKDPHVPRLARPAVMSTASKLAVAQAAKGALEDTASVVRTAAARAILMMYGEGVEVETVAVPALVKELTTAPGAARLLAANIVDDLATEKPELVRPHVEAVKAAKQGGSGYVGRVVDHTLATLGVKSPGSDKGGKRDRRRKKR